MDSKMTHRSTQAVIVPVLSLIAILISIAPLILHWHNRNFCATCLICWFLVLNVFNVINALIWPNDDMDSWWSGAGLCDLEVKVMIGSYVAVPGALVGIFRSLACVLDTSRATLVPSKQERWQNSLINILFCVAVPVTSMITHIIYQKNRYILNGFSGCINSFDESLVSLMLAFIWPPVICFIAAYYCGLVLYRLHKYRSQFDDILHSSNSNLSKSRFMRLFLLAFVMLLAILPTQSYVVFANVRLSLPWHPYSWSVAHGPQWNTIPRFPSKGQVFFDRWVPISAGFMQFIFFGCSNDAARMYRSFLRFMDFGHYFAGLRDSLPKKSVSSVAESTTSRARLLFHRKWTPGTRTYVNNSEGDIERIAASPQKFSQSSNVNRFKAPLYSLGQRFFPGHEIIPSVPDLSAPTTSVSTTAWAGVSQSRGSNDFSSTPMSLDFIRVKQVISQQSEMHA